MNNVEFTDRIGEIHVGWIAKKYVAFEGQERYILVDEINQHEYRCVKKNGKFVELVV